MGQIEQGIAMQATRTNQPIPDRVLNAPQLNENLAFYLRAYFDIETERPTGFGLYRIPWSAIIRYAEYYDLDFDTTERLIYFIKEIDGALIKKWNDEHPRK
jgi:hypothetical protein